MGQDVRPLSVFSSAPQGMEGILMGVFGAKQYEYEMELAGARGLVARIRAWYRLGCSDPVFGGLFAALVFAFLVGLGGSLVVAILAFVLGWW